MSGTLSGGFAPISVPLSQIGTSDDALPVWAKIASQGKGQVNGWS